MNIGLGTLYATLGANTVPLRNGLQQGSQMIRGYATDVNRQMAGVQSNALSMGNAVRGLFAAMATRKILEQADQYKLLQSRINLASKSVDDLAGFEKKLANTADDTYTRYEDTVNLYYRMERSTRSLGKGQGDLLKVTKAINQSLTVSGTAMVSAQAALVQLSQGMVSGVLRGEELNSVLEQAPVLAEMLARGLNTTIGQLRKMGADGELTTERVFNALLSQADSVQKEFDAMDKTVAQSSTRMFNNLLRLIGSIDEAGQFTSRLSGLIVELADKMRDVANSNMAEEMAKVLNIAIGMSKVFAVGGGLYLGIGAVSGAIGILTAELVLAHAAMFTATGTAAKLAAGFKGLFSISTVSLSGVAVSSVWAASAVGKLAVATGVLFSFWAGWELGELIRKEYKTVDVETQFLIVGMQREWDKFVVYIEKLWIRMSSSWDRTVNSIQNKLADTAKYLSEKTKGIWGFDDISYSLNDLSQSLAAGIADQGTTVEESIKQLDTDLANRIKIANETLSMLLKERDGIVAGESGIVPERSRPKIEPQKEIDQQTAAMNRLLDKYNRELEVLGKTKAEQKAIEEARKNNIQVGGEQYNQLLELMKKVEEAKQKQKDVKDQEKQLEKFAEMRLKFTEEYIKTVKGETAAVRAELMEQAKLYEQAGVDKIKIAEWVAARQLEIDTGWRSGVQRSLKDYRENLQDDAKFIENSMLKAFQSMESSMMSFIKNGKASFSELGTVIAEMMVQLLIIRPMMAGITGGIGQMFGFANGGAFSNGRVMAFANGGVVDQPTFFGMSNGRMGVMGEAGEEAILPLTRTSSGKLGVEATGISGGGGGGLQIQQNLYFNEGVPELVEASWLKQKQVLKREVIGWIREYQTKTGGAL